MWTKEYSKVFQGVKPENVWGIWANVNAWPQWHDDLDSCKLERDFKAGNHFFLKPQGQRPVKIDLLEVEEGKKFTDCTTFPGAKMYDTHRIEDTPGGVKLTNTLWVVGPLKWLWVFLVARKVAASVPDEMEALIRLARVYET